MILLLSIASLLFTMTIGLSHSEPNFEWMDILLRYENELSIIVFSIALLAYISVVSIRFYRPNNQHGGKWLTVKLIPDYSRKLQQIATFMVKPQHKAKV